MLLLKLLLPEILNVFSNFRKGRSLYDEDDNSDSLSDACESVIEKGSESETDDETYESLGHFPLR